MTTTGTDKAGHENYWHTPVWYSALSAYTFPTSFIKLREDEIQTIVKGESKGAVVEGIIQRLAPPMKAIPGNAFVFTDAAAPTDTTRFKAKRGAVFSAESAWKVISRSDKIRKAAFNGMVKYICIRPFRRINRTREFRLFIYGKELRAMSQYWLIRHYRRLEGPKMFYWEKACSFVKEISWLLPSENLVMDIYFTSAKNIMIIDINQWGAPTAPLLLNTWDRNWEQTTGIALMPPPVKISGDVNVSF